MNEVENHAEDAREQINIALDHISDEHNMTIARQGVELSVETGNTEVE